MVVYKNSLAVICSVGDKFEISVLQGGKITSQKVRRKDFFPLTSGSFKSGDLKGLATMAENFTVTDEKMNEARDFFNSETAAFSDLAEVAMDDFSSEKAWAFFSFLKKTFFFKQVNDDEALLFTPVSTEEMNAAINKANSAEREKIDREAFIQRLKNRKLNLPEDAKFAQDIESLALGKTDKSRSLHEAKITETAENAHDILLKTKLWDFFKNPHPSRHGIRTKNTDLALPSPPDEERFQPDFPAYAIDNSHSTDPDDAISFDGKYLWVHIADPASVIEHNSPLDLTARSRGSTLYIPEGPFWMISASSLADFALGLKNPSLALSFRILLDENGDITETKIFKTRLNVTRCTYEEVDEQLDSPQFAPFFKLAEKNIERRKNAGAVFIDFPEVHISVEGDNEKQVKIEKVHQWESAKMIREMMLLAGEAVAKFAVENALPFAFVSQEKPDLPKKIPEGLAGQFALRKTMKSRSVGTSPRFHSGIGVSAYCQVTSPLRRYSDLACHQQLRRFLNGKPLIEKEEFLEKIAAADAAFLAANKSMRESDLHYKLVYLLQNKPWQGDATVLDVRDKKAVIFIHDLALETQIVNGTGAAVTDIITVHCGKVNLPKLQADFFVK